MKRTLTMIVICLLFNSCDSTKTPEEIEYEKTQEIIANGMNFPYFELPDQDENIIKSNQFEDGYVFYLIWASWCTSCIDNIVAVKDMKKMGLLKDIRFVSISIDEDKGKWENILYQYDMKDYMNNLLMGRDAENVLNNFRYKTMINSERKISYKYIAPAYCLVKDGIILDNNPKILPKDGDKFLELFN